MTEYKHEILICPDTKNGERGYWTASVGAGGRVSYDGTGRTIEEALCDLIDTLADECLPLS